MALLIRHELAADTQGLQARRMQQIAGNSNGIAAARDWLELDCENSGTQGGWQGEDEGNVVGAVALGEVVAE